jgi:hypothetical protein
VRRLACSSAWKLSFSVSLRFALPFSQFALLDSPSCVQLRLITILGNRGCVAVASFFGVSSPIEIVLHGFYSVSSVLDNISKAVFFSATGYTPSLLTGECRPLCKKRCENGYCHKPNKCRCNPGYRKMGNVQECVPICTHKCINGTCTSPDFCTCKPGYKKDLADPLNNKCIPKCAPACVHGVCVAPGLCHCNEGYVKDINYIARNVCVHVNLMAQLIANK